MFPLRSLRRANRLHRGMNQTLFLIGDWPVHLTDALIAFAALTLLLLLIIAIVVGRSGKRDALLAQVQAARADELEDRLHDMMRAQAEASGRVAAMAQALSGRQANPRRRVHGLEHVVGELAHLRGDLLNRLGDEPQLLVRQDDNFS